MTPKNKRAAPVASGAAQKSTSCIANRKPPQSIGQCAQVFNLISENQPIWSLTLTADYAIPEAAARVHDLREMGFNIITTIKQTVVFRGVERHNVASYSFGTPAWPRPGFIDGGGD